MAIQRPEEAPRRKRRSRLDNSELGQGRDSHAPLTALKPHRGFPRKEGFPPLSALMQIRPGHPGDANAVASLIASFQPILTLEPGGAGAEQFLASVSEAAERHYLESPRYSYLVAELEGETVGVVAMRDRTHLFHLFVAATHQRLGVARALWEQARELSLRAGSIAEFTVNSSLNAVPVYRSFGFISSGPVMQVHGIAFLPMRLTLRNGP